MGFFGNDSFGQLKKSFGDLEKYTKDFELVEEADRKGRLRKKAVYTGLWYVCRDADSARWKLILSLLAAILVLLMDLRLLTMAHLTAGQYPVMVPLLAGLFPLLYLWMGIFSLPFRGKPMRRDQYMHSFIRVSRSATAVGILTLLGGVISLILRAFWQNWEFYPEDWVFQLGCLLISAVCLVLILLLRSISIAERENKTFAEGNR